jgi:hypothetical protein
MNAPAPGGPSTTILPTTQVGNWWEMQEKQAATHRNDLPERTLPTLCPLAGLSDADETSRRGSTY